MRADRRLIWWSALPLGALYLAGLAPSVHVHDAGELTAAAWTLGLGHPPGAPLYMIVAKLFMTVLPFGHIAWRANVLSAVLAVALYLVIALWAERRTLGALTSIIVGAAVAVSPTVWSQAEMAEVYTMQALLLAAFLVAIDLGWRAEVCALLWGLLLACHVGLAPLTPVVLAVLAFDPHQHRFHVLRACRLGLWCLAPLALYLYVPLRAAVDPPVEWSRPESLQELWWYLSNQNVRARAFELSAGAYFERVMEYGGIILANLHLMLVASVVGLWLSPRRALAFLALLVVLFDAAFVVLLDTAPLASEAYGIPAIVALSMLAGLGLAEISSRQLAFTTLRVALFAGIVANTVLSAPRVSLEGSFVVRDTVENLLDQVPRDAVVFTQEDNTTFPLVYLIEVEGARPDIEIFDRAGNFFNSPYDRQLFRVEGDLPDYRRSFEDDLVAGFLAEGRRVIYSAPWLEFQPRRWSLVARGTIGVVTEDDRKLMPAVAPPRPRRSSAPDWMSRQILAMDHARRAASELVDGRRQAAVAEIEAAARLADIAELHLRLAQLLLSADEEEEALASALKALHDKPDLIPALLIGASAAEEVDRPEQAEAMISRAREIDPQSPLVARSRAELAIRNQRWREAEEHLTTAVALGADDSDLWINRALVRERLADIDGALEDIERVTGSDPECRVHGIHLRLLMRAGAPTERTAVALCELLSCRDASSLGSGEMQELLLLAARLRGPECVRTWLTEAKGFSAPTATVIRAYLETMAAQQRGSQKESPQ